MSSESNFLSCALTQRLASLACSYRFRCQLPSEPTETISLITQRSPWRPACHGVTRCRRSPSSICPFSRRHLGEQKQHRLRLLCDLAGTAGRGVVPSLGGPASHMSLSGCDGAAVARMLSWLFHSLWFMCRHFTHLAADNWLPALMGSRVTAWLEWPLHHFRFRARILCWC